MPEGGTEEEEVVQPVDPHVPPKPPDKEALDALVNPDNARKLIVNGVNGKVSDLNPFVVRNFLFTYLGEMPEFASAMRKTGQYYVKSLSSQQTHKLLAMTDFCGRPVTVTAPYHMNTVKARRGLFPLLSCSRSQMKR